MNKKILIEANKLIKHEKVNKTFIDNVNLFKCSTFRAKGPLTYDFCLVIVLQGKKLGYLPNKKFVYDSNNYLVVPLSLPFECETIASKEEPYICITIDINKDMIYEIISLLDNKEIKQNKTVQMAIFQDKVTTEIEDIIFRLLKILQSKTQSKILGDAILKELFFRIATGENAYFLHKMFLEHKHESKIANSLKKIHHNYNKQFNVEQLAKEQEMSVSSFHNHFKSITSYSPLQYIKKIRLNKAKDLIINEAFQVNNAAYQVGYESASQFSRDFKSHFGYPPKEAKAL